MTAEQLAHKLCEVVPDGLSPQLVLDAISILTCTMIGQYAREPAQAMMAYASHLASVNFQEIDNQKN